MYKILLPTNHYLEGQLDLTFELNNQVFSKTDTSVLPGSFSFPATLPLTRRNKNLLENPHLVTNSKNWQTYEGVWVELYGVKMFYGTLTVTGANPAQVQVNIVANPVKALKSVKLKAIDLGGERDKDAFLTWGLYMFDTIRFPENYDHIFVPMYNEDRNDYAFDSGDPNNLLYPFYNYYDVGTQTFDMDTGALVPFIKVEYLLQQIFAYEDTGFAFVNAWQNPADLELRRLYLFNNWDMRTLNTTPAPDLPTTFNLANHVPDITATDFLKKLMAQWGLGLFTNIFNRTIRLVPIQPLLQRPAVHDWSQYAIGRPAREDADSPPGRYNYEQPAELPRDVPAPEDITTVFNTLADFNAALPLADGYYYIETEHSIVYVETAWPFDPKEAWLQHRGVTLDGDLDRLDTGMTSLLHYNFSDRYNAPVVASRFYETTDPDGNTIYERRVTDPPVAVFFYRGFNDVGYANPFPVACNHVWNPDETGGGKLDITVDTTPDSEAARSLNWFGDYGLFETAHKLWAYMLLDGKHCTLQLALPVSVLVKFSFEEKVRVGEMEYFVKKLRVSKPLGHGRVLVEASMVSTI